MNMKKKLLASMLALCLMLTLLPVMALADNSTSDTPSGEIRWLRKGESEILTIKTDTITEVQTGDGWSYDPATKTLTLNNYQQENDALDILDDCKLVLHGTNKLNYLITNRVVHSADIQIEGDGTLYCSEYYIESPTIMRSGTIIVDAEKDPDPVYTRAAIQLKDRFIMTGGTLKANCTQKAGRTYAEYGISLDWLDGQLIFLNGNVEAYGTVAGIQYDDALYSEHAHFFPTKARAVGGDSPNDSRPLHISSTAVWLGNSYREVLGISAFTEKGKNLTVSGEGKDYSVSGAARYVRLEPAETDLLDGAEAPDCKIYQVKNNDFTPLSAETDDYLWDENTDTLTLKDGAEIDNFQVFCGTLNLCIPKGVTASIRYLNASKGREWLCNLNIYGGGTLNADTESHFQIADFQEVHLRDTQIIGSTSSSNSHPIIADSLLSVESGKVDGNFWIEASPNAYSKKLVQTLGLTLPKSQFILNGGTVNADFVEADTVTINGGTLETTEISGGELTDSCQYMQNGGVVKIIEYECDNDDDSDYDENGKDDEEWTWADYFHPFQSENAVFQGGIFQAEFGPIALEKADGSCGTLQVADNLSVTGTYNGKEVPLVLDKELHALIPASRTSASLTARQEACLDTTNIRIASNGKLPQQKLTFPASTVSKTYGDGSFTNAASNSTANGGAVTYTSSNPAVAKVDAASGQVTILGAGSATITATAAAVPGQYAETSASYTLQVAKKSVTVKADNKTRVYGAANPALTFTVPANALVTGDTAADLGVSLICAATATSPAGTPVSITGTANSKNYAVTVTPGTLTITQADFTGSKTAKVSAKRGSGTSYDLSTLLAGIDGAALGNPVASTANGVLTGTVTKEGKSLRFTLADTAKIGASDTITVPVTSTNYKNFSITLTVTAAEKDVPTLTVQPIEKIYDGKPLSAADIRGAAKFGKDTVPGTWSWGKTVPSLQNVADSGVYEVVFTPEDTENYASATASLSVIIRQATPTGRASYTSISEAGKTLADAKLTAAFDVSGTIAWKLPDTTEVTRGTRYDWVFTPADGNFAPANGSAILWAAASSGGGGGGGGGGVVSNDHAISVPSKLENGSVSLGSKNAAKGDTVTITVKPNAGYVLDKLTVTDNHGNTLTLKDNGNGTYSFTMPGGDVSIAASFTKAGSTAFRDVPANAYFAKAVQWAVDKNITTGTGEDTFSPDESCTRAQMAVFLWRVAGSPEPKAMSRFADVPADAYYAKAVAWAVENGITTGTGETTFSPDETCTRAQMAALLYRYAKTPAVTGNAPFADTRSDAYYYDAVRWAVEKGVTTGTSETTFSPDEDCTRAQIVTFLYRAES